VTERRHDLFGIETRKPASSHTMARAVVVPPLHGPLSHSIRAPKALTGREVVRYLRAVEHRDSARDTVVALLPFYVGLRVGEVVGLDLDDLAHSARKGTRRVRGKGRDGGKPRELPLTRPELRAALTSWLDDRPTWPGADAAPAVLLNRRGGRLSDRSARTIITTLGEHVGLGHDDRGVGSARWLVGHHLRLGSGAARLGIFRR
jgi:site-specific recombinase XerC